jgi:hypothetical protein
LGCAADDESEIVMRGQARILCRGRVVELSLNGTRGVSVGKHYGLDSIIAVFVLCSVLPEAFRFVERCEIVRVYFP